MTDIETLKKEIIECLRLVDPEKVVLFGRQTLTDADALALIRAEILND